VSTNRDTIYHATASYAVWSDTDTVRQPNATDGDVACCSFANTADQPDVCANNSADVYNWSDGDSI